MIYFISDLHFGHNRGFLYEPRGFTSIEEHDTAIIERWNNVVKNDDEVYILGDLMLNDNEHGIECLNKLNGTKYFIRGNHDTDTRIQLYSNEANILNLGASAYLRYGKYHFYLSHFPTLTGNLEKESLSQMTLNIFGHTHSKEKFYQDRPYMYNVACDANNCTPVSIDDIIKAMNDKMIECKNML